MDATDATTFSQCAHCVWVWFLGLIISERAVARLWLPVACCCLPPLASSGASAIGKVLATEVRGIHSGS